MANDARKKPEHRELKFVIIEGWGRKVPGPFYGLLGTNKGTFCHKQ